MSGLEALGIGCNVMQVISFAHETVEFCKGVYRGQSFNDYNQQTVASLQGLSAQLQTHFQKAKLKTTNEKQLADIASKCNVAARALEDEVNFLGSHHAKGDLRAALSVVIKTKWRRSRLERLEKSLRNHQQTMESYLLARICTQADALELQQSQGFEKLDTDIRFFTSQYASGHTQLADLIKLELVSVKGDVVKTTMQSEKSVKKHVDTVVASTEESITRHITTRTNELVRKMDQTTIESDVKSSTKEQQGRFLESLRYEGMNQRKNDIASSFEHTFEWIFDSDPDTNCTQLWDDFHDWLKSDTNIYWINGKPGSGKSTLVKYLLNDPSTKAALNIWNANSTVLSHFLWSPGSRMQKNIKGFLCSILHQAFFSAKGPTLVKSIMNTSNRFLLKREVGDWDIQELKDVCFAVLSSDMFPACIFLDGLDEVCEEDGQLSLLKLVDELRTLPEVKVCVASRPEPILQSNLCRHQQLRLQDLTYNDMLAFASGQIQPYITCDKISEEFGWRTTEYLVWKAEGVFLWLHLVLRSFIRGIEKGDPETILMQRLEELPSELTKLYSDMWARMNEDARLYREAAARYFNLVVLESKMSKFGIRVLHFIGATQAELQDIILNKRGSIGAEALEEVRIESMKALEVRCAGLLEIKEFGRLRVLDPTNYGLIRGKGDMHIQFIHRTAYDFITDTKEGHRICAQDSYSLNTLRIQLAKGHLVMAKFFRDTTNDIDRVYRYLHPIEDPSMLDETIQILRLARAWYNEHYYRLNPTLYQKFPCIIGPHFLALFAEPKYRSFVLSSIKESSNPSSLATHILRNLQLRCPPYPPIKTNFPGISYIETLNCYLRPLLSLDANITCQGPCAPFIPQDERQPLLFISAFAKFMLNVLIFKASFKLVAEPLRVFMENGPNLHERIPLFISMPGGLELIFPETFVQPHDWPFQDGNYGRVSTMLDIDDDVLRSSRNLDVFVVLIVDIGLLVKAFLMSHSVDMYLRIAKGLECQPAQMILIHVDDIRPQVRRSTRCMRFRPTNVEATEPLLSLLLQFVCGHDVSEEVYKEVVKAIRDFSSGSPSYEMIDGSVQHYLAEQECGYRYSAGDEWMVRCSRCRVCNSLCVDKDEDEDEDEDEDDLLY
ncbi:uncharacterized protein F4812DRAFT_455168 [Daldinia caldariorum]|uniref:uncharacterized protein n=1 Tax=Daldinia caldariorum TaxID=326644 RepID=UPI0020081F63|nr:uncharacterized protein F4812DRAFT_455168 [Daldinia caldariorum]KAI1471056.1 hypothetical protein F4812DRAFT_455168 [Daldinia caldariorum]